MNPIQSFSSGVLAEVIRRQPASKARTDFAWQVAVGPALARVTTVTLTEGTLTVTARDERWLKEIARAREVILQKMQHLLGANAIRKIQT
jgi:predicted nucleic acid-binding Zn ribbon protein